MDIKNDIKPISYVKTNAADMLKQVNETRNPIIITQNGEAKAVLMDTESYQDMRKALGIMKLISMSEKEIENNQVEDHKSVMQTIKNSLPDE
jgi:prevent-host-death family protein